MDKKNDIVQYSCRDVGLLLDRNRVAFVLTKPV